MPQKKTHYACTTTVPRVQNGIKDISENLLTVWLLVRTYLFLPSNFWTTDAKFDKFAFSTIK